MVCRSVVSKLGDDIGLLGMAVTSPRGYPRDL